MPVHFLHIGKTGGTAIKNALRSAGMPDTPFGPVQVHRHRDSRLGLMPPEDFVFFCVRDPISRFVSGFNSRLRKGAPLYRSEWTEEERISFAAFPTAQRLAEGLASGDFRERRRARFAMEHIRHLRRLQMFLESPDMVRERLRQIIYVGRQETLNNDWVQIRDLLDLPEQLALPRGELAHRAAPVSGDVLDDRALAALREWYAVDYQIVEFCEELRLDRGWGELPRPRSSHITGLSAAGGQGGAAGGVAGSPAGDAGAPPAQITPEPAGARPDRVTSEPTGGTADMDTSALERLVAEADDRPSLWAAFLAAVEARQVAEIGVYKGLFAEYLLDRCPGITTYYMVDPWRHLEEWNKPANKSDDQFEQIYAEAMRRTEQHAERRVVLRGRTTEVIGKVPDGSLDFAYVDGDHTLRGITLDLQTVFGKVRDGGWVGGDDFCRSIWQHSEAFEPTMVFPYAVHFAEAVGARIYALPFRQFLIEKQRDGAFEFVDLTATYGTTELLSQVRPPVSSRAAAKRAAQVPPAVREGAGRARKIARRASRKVLREVRARTRG